MIDREKLVDAVSVWNRGNEAVYFNRLGTDGEWVHPAGAREALEKERGRQRTTPESDNFRQVHSRLSDTMEPRFRPQLDQISRQAQPLLAPTREARQIPVTRLGDVELARALTDAGYRARIEADRAAALKEDRADPARRAAGEVVQAAAERENTALAELSAEADRRAQLSADQVAAENAQRQQELDAQRHAELESGARREAEPS